MHPLMHPSSFLRNKCDVWRGILALSRIYEVPTVVIGNTTDLYDLLNTFKENGGLSETKTKRRLEGAFSR